LTVASWLNASSRGCSAESTDLKSHERFVT
jgi:hypothetical protein